MDEENYPERPNTTRIKILIVLVVVLGVLWFVGVLDFFEEPVEPEGIFVRLILFFKQNTLL